MYGQVHVHLYPYMCLHVYVYVYVHACVYAYVGVDVDEFVDGCVCLCVCVIPSPLPLQSGMPVSCHQWWGLVPKVHPLRGLWLGWRLESHPQGVVLGECLLRVSGGPRNPSAAARDSRG